MLAAVDSRRCVCVRCVGFEGYKMELLEFFNREESKYADLYSELLSDSSILNDNAENVILLVYFCLCYSW